MRSTLIKGGHVCDPAQAIDRKADVLLIDGRVEAVDETLDEPDGAEVIDASGLVVVPGLIDLHVHLREPGQEDSETIATGARAAASGGFTGVCAMPNTDPVTDNQAAVGFVMAQAERAGAARVYPIAAITLGQKGTVLSEFGELVSAGAVAVSDDGHPVVSSHMMRTALEYAQTFGIPVANHCEELSLSNGAAMHEGVMSTRLGLKGMPSAAEDIMVARDVALAELTGGHIHLCHVSTHRAVSVIRQAKERGVHVTSEAAPHHFTLTDSACEGYDTAAKMKPPLREERDRLAIRDGLLDGTIDVIATDHAPHEYELKEREFDDAAFGIVGLETAFGLAHTELVMKGGLSLVELINRMSAMPAKVFNLPGGTLVRGSPADVVLLDVGETWTVDPDAFLSKSRNTPFGGWKLTGRVVTTLIGGAVVHRR